MATTRLILQNEIYEILQKTPTAYGLYTPTKVQAMLNDSLDFIAGKMMKVTNGWLVKQKFLDIVGESNYVSLPTGTAIINFIKIKNSPSDATYSPLSFSENSDSKTLTDSVPVNQGAMNYHLVNGKIFLDPKPADSVAEGLLIEYLCYPSQLTGDAQKLSSEMDLRPFVNYAKWRSASMLYALGSEGVPPWLSFENQWHQACLELISRRFRQPTPLKAFDDY